MPKEYSIDPQRIYLTGLSMGGYGTWDLLARKPDLFAAGGANRNNGRGTGLTPSSA